MNCHRLAANVIAAGPLRRPGHDETRREPQRRGAALLEVLNDALGSVGVIIATAVVARTGWTPGRRRGLVLIPAPGGDAAAFGPGRAHGLHSRGWTWRRCARTCSASTTSRRSTTACLDRRLRHAGADRARRRARRVYLRDGHRGDLDRLQNCVAEHFPVRIQHATLQLEPSRTSSTRPPTARPGQERR